MLGLKRRHVEEEEPPVYQPEEEEFESIYMPTEIRALLEDPNIPKHVKETFYALFSIDRVLTVSDPKVLRYEYHKTRALVFTVLMYTPDWLLTPEQVIKLMQVDIAADARGRRSFMGFERMMIVRRTHEIRQIQQGKRGLFERAKEVF